MKTQKEYRRKFGQWTVKALLNAPESAHVLKFWACGDWFTTSGYVRLIRSNGQIQSHWENYPPDMQSKTIHAIHDYLRGIVLKNMEAFTV